MTGGSGLVTRHASATGTPGHLRGSAPFLSLRGNKMMQQIKPTMTNYRRKGNGGCFGLLGVF